MSKTSEIMKNILQQQQKHHFKNEQDGSDGMHAIYYQMGAVIRDDTYAFNQATLFSSTKKNFYEGTMQSCWINTYKHAYIFDDSSQAKKAQNHGNKKCQVTEVANISSVKTADVKISNQFLSHFNYTNHLIKDWQKSHRGWATLPEIKRKRICGHRGERMDGWMKMTIVSNGWRKFVETNYC